MSAKNALTNIRRTGKKGISKKFVLTAEGIKLLNVNEKAKKQQSRNGMTGTRRTKNIDALIKERDRIKGNLMRTTLYNMLYAKRESFVLNTVLPVTKNANLTPIILITTSP